MSSVARPLIALTVQADLPDGFDHPAQRAQQRGLACPVGAQHGSDAPFRDLQPHALQHRRRTVAGAELLHLEQRRHQPATPR